MRAIKRTKKLVSNMTFMLALTHSYSGRFATQVRELLDSGVKVSQMHVCGDNYVHCHFCPANFTPPQKPEGSLESLGECPGCKTAIVFLHCDKD